MLNYTHHGYLTKTAHQFQFWATRENILNLKFLDCLAVKNNVWENFHLHKIIDMKESRCSNKAVEVY